MWKVRLTAYVGGFLAIAATLAAGFGWGTYDHATGMFDAPPVNVYAVGGLFGALVSQAVAALALVRGWGRK